MINVTEIVRKKTKRHVPKWVIRWLEKHIHQDECNAFLAQYGHLRNFDFLDAVLTHCLHCTYTAYSSAINFARANNHPSLTEQQLRSAKPSININAVFVSNHPLGGLDGIILLKILHEAGYQPCAIVNDLLMHITPMYDLFVPVNKVGIQAREYVALQQQLWASDNAILTFPAGACSRLQHGEIKDLEWKNTFLRNAIRYQRDIVPVYFEGTNSRRFYRVARWRKRLHIPINIEMLLLPDEMFRSMGSHYNVYLGQPIPWQSLSSLSVSDIRQQAYNLKNLF